MKMDTNHQKYRQTKILILWQATWRIYHLEIGHLDFDDWLLDFSL